MSDLLPNFQFYNAASPSTAPSVIKPSTALRPQTKEEARKLANNKAARRFRQKQRDLVATLQAKNELLQMEIEKLKAIKEEFQKNYEELQKIHDMLVFENQALTEAVKI